MCTKNEKDKAFPTLKWETILRFRCLEIILLWEGKLTTNHLQSTFGIKRQQASRDFKVYRDIAPDNMVYDPSIKGYTITPSFTPMFSKGVAEEYFHLVEANGFFEDISAQADRPASFTHLLNIPNRHIAPPIVRKVIEACRNGLRLEIKYGSMRCPEGEERIIAPHSIVSSGYRWHTRAYCEKNRGYRDFMLGRIFDIYDELGSALNDSSEDYDWHNDVSLELIPNPDLSNAQQRLIARERGFANGMQILKTRRATANYLLQFMQIPKHHSSYPLANPVILGNPSVMEELLFD
jgi:predicted DNA-binding transcriptional regulator YafY